MEISPELLQHLSRLAMIALSSQEEQRLAQDLSTILTFVEKLQEVPTEHVAPLYHVHGVMNVTRDDIPDENVERDALMSGVPAQHNGYIVVPTIFTDESPSH